MVVLCLGFCNALVWLLTNQASLLIELSKSSLNKIINHVKIWSQVT